MANKMIKVLLPFMILISGSLSAADPIPKSNQQIDQPLQEMPYHPGIDLSSIDHKTDPCQDFYQYSCGAWIQNNPIPEDQSRWTVTGRLVDETQRYLWGILEQLNRSQEKLLPEQVQLKDFYNSCMDENSIEKKGRDPLLQEWKRIEAIKSLQDVPRVMGMLRKSLISTNMFFGFGSLLDLDGAQRGIAVVDSGGLGLPDSALYTQDTPRKIREQYLSHISNMLQLMGQTQPSAQKDASAILAIETTLAKAMMARSDQRNPENLKHIYQLADLQKLTPGFTWSSFFNSLDIPNPKVIQVNEPLFLKTFDRVLSTHSLDQLKAYLRWHLLRDRAPLLSQAFVNQDFNFYGKILEGIPKPAPRWKQCVQWVDRQLSESLGREYAQRTFSPELKTRVQDITKRIEEAMRQRLVKLDWMSEATKKNALAKVNQISLKIGFPEQWRDYKAIAVESGDFYGNVLRSSEFEQKRQLLKIDKPSAREEWLMSPQTVGAMYDPQANDINFPAAILQTPFFDAKMDAAQHYGNTGAAIGHELTHGFDDAGRRFDGQGSLKDWWTKADTQAFDQRAQCLVDQYGQYEGVDGIKINSKLTLGEDLADLNGTILAYLAWKAEVAVEPTRLRDGMTSEQRFFVGFSQWACGSQRPEAARITALNDPHSPSKYRVNGVLANMPEFQAAFHCKRGQAMVRATPCRIW